MTWLAKALQFECCGEDMDDLLKVTENIGASGGIRQCACRCGSTKAACTFTQVELSTTIRVGRRETFIDGLDFQHYRKDQS